MCSQGMIEDSNVERKMSLGKHKRGFLMEPRYRRHMGFMYQMESTVRGVAEFGEEDGPHGTYVCGNQQERAPALVADCFEMGVLFG